MAEDTLISLEFLLSLKEKHLFCKVQLFSPNTDVAYFPESFYAFQTTIDEYNNLQIPK